jgi:arabinofuranosyltransferase
VVTGLLVVHLAGRGLDDFFITYRYALHLVRGQGFVFNLGERVFGLTNPGFALLLAGLGRLVPLALPALATVVFGLALLGLAGLLLRGAARQGRLAEGLAGGTLLVTSSYLWAQQGGEGIPMLALLALAAELSRRRPLWAGLVGGFAAWCRPEAALGVAFLCLLVWAEERRFPWRLAGAASGVTAAGLGLAGWYFGTPLPNSLAAKQAMAAGISGSWAGPVRFWLRSVRLVARHLGPLWAPAVGLGAAGQVPLFAWGGRAGRVLVLLSASLAILYPLSGVPFFPWYTLPMAVAVLYGIAHLVGAAVRAILRRWGSAPRLAVVAAAVAGCLLAAPVGLSVLPASWHWHRVFNWPAFMERYRKAGEWLAASSPPAATVAYYEVGALGYFSERTVIDLLGIVSPEVLPWVRRGDFEGAMLARPADFAVLDSARGGLMPSGAPWFRAAYAPVARFGELTILRRDPAVPLPRPPRP